MIVKNLSLRAVAKASGVNYTTACAVLRGKLIRPQHLAAITRAVEKAPCRQ